MEYLEAMKLPQNRSNHKMMPGALIVLFLFGLFYSRVFASGTDSTMTSPIRDSSLAVHTPPRVGRTYQFPNDREFVYKNPKPLQFLQQIPGDFSIYFRETFQVKNLWKMGAMAGVTALMVAYDQPIVDEAQRFGRQWGISNKEGLDAYFSIAGLPVRGPTDVGSAMYFIGDGWTHTLIAASFFGYGLAAKNTRALQTASQLAEGMITTGLISVQFLKHITGRETPNRASAPGGVWRLFPNQIDYHKHVPNYDAYPSGHLATAMMTVTVIAENYPEHKYIRPLGYTLMTIVSYQMLNNGVHWISDYPLALSMGYAFGKIAVRRGRTEVEREHSTGGMNRERDNTSSFALAPVRLGPHTIGVGIVYTF
jgi:hypothetical protein